MIYNLSVQSSFVHSSIFIALFHALVFTLLYTLMMASVYVKIYNKWVSLTRMTLYLSLCFHAFRTYDHFIPISIPSHSRRLSSLPTAIVSESCWLHKSRWIQLAWCYSSLLCSVHSFVWLSNRLIKYLSIFFFVIA